MSDRTCKIVVGYHPETPAPPRDARRSGLTQRVAVVLDSYRADRVDLYFDAELFLATAQAIFEAVSADRIEILRAPTEPTVGSLEELEVLWKALPEVDQEPPERLSAFRSGSAVCIAIPEHWSRVGGPEPYHDSYTTSFFAAYLQAEGVAESVANAARKVGAEAAVIRAAV